MSDLQKIILHNLVENEVYLRAVLPFIDRSYFEDQVHATTFDLIHDYFAKYNNPPSVSALEINLGELEHLSDDTGQEVYECIQSLKVPQETVEHQWLMDQTEQWCQDKAIFNAVMESIGIIDGKDQNRTKQAIPELLQDALNVSFDNSVGHDFLADARDRYEFYHQSVARVGTDLEIFNKITKGGFPRKTLNIAMAGTGVGKSLFMCSIAAGCLLLGYNVLYITMEMAEMRIAERIDANLLDVDLDDIEKLPREDFMTRVHKLQEKSTGRLIIKEYPTSSAHAGHFRHLLNELESKQNLKPDIVFIDYLNICASSRTKFGGSVNSYSYIKSIAEELRGLAVEFDVPIISATQTNRDGYDNSDVDLTNTSESFGLPATADMMFALMDGEELRKLNQIAVKQLKNRYSDIGNLPRFTVGIERPKMRLYDTEQSAQDNVSTSIDDELPPYDPEDDPLAFNRETKVDMGQFKF